MKRLTSIFLTLVLALGLLAGCGQSSTSEGDSTQAAAEEETKVIKVGASPSPHAEILRKAAEVLKDQGYELDIVEYSDYVQPNVALANGDLDANYFQHLPYLEDYNSQNGTDLVSAGAIHYEPFGIYAGKTDSLDKLADGAKVAVPNDATNEARALLLLEANGIITLKEDAGLNATVNDIAENPYNVTIIELAAEQVARAAEDADFLVLNGNYALQANFSVEKDALAKEEADSEAAQTYANIVAVREGDETRADIQTLIEVLKSDDIKSFIESTYEGAVLPVE